MKELYAAFDFQSRLNHVKIKITACCIFVADDDGVSDLIKRRIVHHLYIVVDQIKEKRTLNSDQNYCL